MASENRVTIGIFVALVVIIAAAFGWWFLGRDSVDESLETAAAATPTPVPEPTPTLEERLSSRLSGTTLATSDIVVMYGGDIVERGATDQIFKNPAHPYTKGLLAARPQIAQATGTRRRLPTIPGTVPPLTELPAGCRFSGRCPQEIPRCANTRPQPVETANGSVVCCHNIEMGSVSVGIGAGA